MIIFIVYYEVEGKTEFLNVNPNDSIQVIINKYNIKPPKYLSVNGKDYCYGYGKDDSDDDEDEDEEEENYYYNMNFNHKYKHNNHKNNKYKYGYKQKKIY